MAFFQDFPVLENAKTKFQDFPGFPGPVRTLFLVGGLEIFVKLSFLYFLLANEGLEWGVGESKDPGKLTGCVNNFSCPV